MRTHVVIMAGGVGSRFWPLSTPEYPKQFIDILGCGRSLIQLTADRFEGICPQSNFWVVTNKAYVGEVRKQLPGIPENHILAEPAARNTAPCIAWACWSIKAEDPDANIVVTPSDAVVMNPEGFRAAIGDALAFTAESDAIVTIGIRPSRPETGYGYVEAESSAEPAAASKNIAHVKQFREKPDLPTAQAYLAAGNFLWNAGIFVWNAATITSSIRTYKPELAAIMDQISAAGDVEALFPTCEKVSIDYAVMEPASADSKVWTRPAEFGWSDLGNWQSLYDKLREKASEAANLNEAANRNEAAADTNAAVGNVKFYECSNCVVHAADARRVVLQGLDGYIVSEKDGRLLVCRRTEEQRIREFSAD